MPRLCSIKALEITVLAVWEAALCYYAQVCQQCEFRQTASSSRASLIIPGITKGTFGAALLDDCIKSVHTVHLNIYAQSSSFIVLRYVMLPVVFTHILQLYAQHWHWGNHQQIRRTTLTNTEYLIASTIRSLTSTWMETFSALLALCAGNSPVTGEFPHKGQ